MSEIFEYFDNCQTFNVAVLEQLYVKMPNTIFARHKLETAKQKFDQTSEDFKPTLIKLSKYSF